MAAMPRSHDPSNAGSPSNRVAGCRPLAGSGQNSQRITPEDYVDAPTDRYRRVTLAGRLGCCRSAKLIQEMCGGFTLSYSEARVLAAELGVRVESLIDYKPRYNIAPTDSYWIVRSRFEDR